MSVSEGLLRRLSRLNPTSVFLGTLAFILIAFFVPGIAGGVLLLVLLLVLVALAVHSPRQAPAATVLRLVALTLVLVLALTKIF